MDKYITIPDIRRYPCYKSVNCRLLYMHVSMGMDISTRNYAHSWRQLSLELDMPLQQLRTALKQLERDGLVATQQVTQKVTYGLTQQVTHKVTEIHILSINELDEATNEATNSPTNSQTNSQNNSQTNSDKKNINNLNNESLPLTDARVNWSEQAAALAAVLKIEMPLAVDLSEQFRQRQQLKQKTWNNEGDLLAHLIAWAEKRYRPTVKKSTAKPLSDHDARLQEHARTREELAHQDDEVKRKEELQRLKRWRKEWEIQGRIQDIPMLDAQIAKLEAS